MNTDTLRERVRTVYGMLNHILWQIESSDHYNYIPNTRTSGWDYFEAELSQVEETIQRLFLGEDSVQDRLLRILAEVRRFVKSFEVPGAEERWLEIDPNLRHFDVVYDVIQREPKAYLDIERRAERAAPGEVVPHFAFTPTARDLRARQVYFKAIHDENDRLNNRFSEDRVFQNEMVRALALVMRHDFPELFGPAA